MEHDLSIEVMFDSAESAVMKSKDETFIFYLSVKNKLSKQVKVESPPATYQTVQGEEIEQDLWLAGLINGSRGATIRSGAYKKMGIIIDRLKLKKISSGDRLYVSIDAPELSQRFNFGFVCSNEAERTFSLCESNQEEIESAASDATAVSTPTEADVINQTSNEPASNKQEITNLVERLELLEEKFGIAISGLYATSYYQPNGTPPWHAVTINFDVTSLSGGALERSVSISASAYNPAGQLLGTSSTYIDKEEFMGFGSMSLLSLLDQTPAKIRLFPSV